MQLEPRDVEQMLAAMESHFDSFAMDRLLETRFGVSLANLTSVMKNFSQQSVDVVRYFDHRNRVEEFVLALRDARPSVPVFSRILDRAGFARLPAGDLEVLIRASRPGHKDVAAFRSDIARLEATVCRIRTPTSFGTGVLIGPREVLTNHHVIADSLDARGELTGPVTCQFDFKTGSGSYASPMVEESVVSVVASSSSPAMRVDMDIDADPSGLDYAVLAVSDGFSDRPIVGGGDPRGWAQLEPASRELAPHDGLLVLQHPLGLPMKIDIGSVLSLGSVRFRHSVNTEAGSSGSPIFDADLHLMGLHHAGFGSPRGAMPFNQAVRADRIYADLHSKNVMIGGD